MKYTILFIVSCYLGLTHEHIAPQGIPKNVSTESKILQPNVTSTTKHKHLQENGTFAENVLEKDLHANSQPKSSEINERSSIFMKNIRPIHNKLYLSQIRNDPKNSRLMPHEDKFLDEFRVILNTEQKKNDCGHVKEECETNIKKLKEASLKGDLGKRDFFELLKLPLLRIMSKNKKEQKNSHNLNIKLKNNTTKESKIDSGLFDNYGSKKDNLNELNSKELEIILDRFINVSVGKPKQKPANSDKGNVDNNVQEINKSTCKCKKDVFDSENTFYNNDIAIMNDDVI